jgi:hypothetical protein
VNHDDILSLWRGAATYDRTLHLAPEWLTTLKRKRIGPAAFSRHAMFEAVAQSQPALFQGVEVPVAGQARLGLVPALQRALSKGFGDEPCARAQVGPQRVRRTLTVPELMRRWESGRHLVSVTDLHVRGTPLARQIDTRALSAFNLLPRGNAAMQRQEMMTLVISSAGNVTDSHSDDPDGSNHCFIGRKLWLAWDTFEGRAAGLQDCEREPVNDKARFRMDAFCRVPSARWWTVEDGQTLFLPGRFTHKVITLAPYIGIGSFYVTPASCLDSLTRWYVHGPLWASPDADPDGDNAGLVDAIAHSMARRAARLKQCMPAERHTWGFDHARQGVATWRRRWPATIRSRVCREHPGLASLVVQLAAAP